MKEGRERGSKADKAGKERKVFAGTLIWGFMSGVINEGNFLVS